MFSILPKKKYILYVLHIKNLPLGHLSKETYFFS